MGVPSVEAAAILAFWFEEIDKARWFDKDPAFDRLVTRRFAALHEAAARGDRDSWREGAQPCLALILLLDQFPRNMFRDTPRAFATDAIARAVAEHALTRGYDEAVQEAGRQFFYLPFEHSEDLADQARAVALFRERTDNPLWLDYAERHHAVIARFGRFPHRNAVLGRISTAEERAFLADDKAHF